MQQIYKQTENSKKVSFEDLLKLPQAERVKKVQSLTGDSLKALCDVVIANKDSSEVQYDLGLLKQYTKLPENSKKQAVIGVLKQLNIPTLEYPNFEADDCIAIMTKHILSKEVDNKVYIIANDMDYLQLAGPKTLIVNLKYKFLTDNKNWSGDPKKDLFCKIVMGDKSDNIPAVLNKCGPKTALKCYDDPKYFEERLKKENAYELYERNKKLIDFNEIPPEHVYLFKRFRMHL